MTIINETSTHFIYEDHFQGHPVRFYRNKKTNEILINVDDTAKVLGYKNETDMMSDNEALDIINENWKSTGEFPIKKIQT